MPLHKSTRGPRLDPTMISSPLGDFRHTMHIGRGGDTFGDTSFLSTVGPPQAAPDTTGSEIIQATDPELSVNHSELYTEASDSLHNNRFERSESVSSLTLDLDLDLDLGPSMLGEVLGVMDGLTLDPKSKDVLCPQSASSSVEVKQYQGVTELPMKMQKRVNGDKSDEYHVEDRRMTEENGIKPKGLRPKVRFSEKGDEIIRQASEEEESQAFDQQDEDLLAPHSPMRGETPAGGANLSNHKDSPPSPSSSHSSEYEEVAPLDRRRVPSGQSETDSEDEDDEAGKGYTFEDEFDDEIGL